jgi:hypothetical protein
LDAAEAVPDEALAEAVLAAGAAPAAAAAPLPGALGALGAAGQGTGFTTVLPPIF